MAGKQHRPQLSSARDPRALRTREALRRALLRLLERKALDRISIRDICEVADVGYSTFFRHHPSTGSVLNDVAAEQIGRLVGLALPVADAANTRAAAVALCTYVHENRALWLTLLTGGAAGAMREEFIRLSMQIASTRVQHETWPPADIVTILVVSSTIELLSWWLRQKQPLSIEEVAEIHERVIVTPALSGARSTAAPAAQHPKPRSRSSE